MIEIKLYLYDSSKADYKGTDYSAHILSGFEYTDDLTEVLDTAELTLVGLPFSEEFAPTTKFILEIWDYIKTGTTESRNLIETYSLCVSNDTVAKPVLSEDNYYDHVISFTEASVIAQGRVVDNMSLTYKLKDVSLAADVAYDAEELAPPTDKIKDLEPALVVNGHNVTGVNPYFTYEDTFIRKFEFLFSENYMQPSDVGYGEFSTWENWKKYQVVDTTRNVSLPIPLMVTHFGVRDSAEFDTYYNFCAVRTRLLSKGVNDTNWTEEQNFVTMPSLNNTAEANWHKDWRLSELYSSTARGFGVSRSYVSAVPYRLVTTYKKYTDFANTVQNRHLNFVITPNKEYKIIVTLETWDTTADLGNSDTFKPETNKNVCIKSHCKYSVTGVSAQGNPTSAYIADKGSAFFVEPSEDGQNAPSLVMSFRTVTSSVLTKIQFCEAPPVSAYDMFVEAQLKSQTTRKQLGVYIKDTPLAYYCDPEDVVKLQSTQVVESAFNQKNFWEVLLEIGKYIHAIPYIEFGENDRFVVRWRYLGQTNKGVNNATTVNVFNSRSIENYVGALNSYITNMVQLGGEIDEWIVPKSESEDLLVYNDVAVLETSKIMTEITYLGVKCINPVTGVVTDTSEKNITKYVFEKYVYDLLDVDANLTINKGLAIYYNLGENVIRGLNYQLPNINTGAVDTEYAIKRILAQADVYQLGTGATRAIRINNFAFHIKYRTKEATRSIQSRPDLRKYLINSSYEQVPHHIQFNNQQDVSVDSGRFGNQVYGKLIKTGNTEYSIIEWVNNANELKKGGDLIEIDRNWYYVSKTKNTYYQDHIISEVTYSKDYNQLSEIIGIPSEPRFYEISERNIVDRQVVINDQLILGTQTHGGVVYGGDYVVDLLGGSVAYPKYALTEMKNDADNPDTKVENLAKYTIDLIHPISGYAMRNTLSLKWEMKDNFSAGDQVTQTAKSVDSSTTQRIADTSYATMLATQYTDAYGRVDLFDFAIIDDLPNKYLTKEYLRKFPISPIRLLGGSFSLSDYKGEAAKYGDIDDVTTAITLSTTSFTLYTGGLGHTSTNIYDSANNVIVNGNTAYIGDFVTFRQGDACIVIACVDTDGEMSQWEMLLALNGSQAINGLLNSDSLIDSGAKVCFSSDTENFGTNKGGLALIKDCREKIMFNYNLQMLTDSDRFVLSGYLWEQKKKPLYVAVLNEEVNKIIGDTIQITSNNLIYMTTSSIGFNYGGECKIVFDGAYGALNGVDLTNAKSIVLVTKATPAVGNSNEYYFVMARNVDGLTDAEKRETWYISYPDNNFFEKQ